MNSLLERFLRRDAGKRSVYQQFLEMVRFGSVGVTSTLVYFCVFWVVNRFIDSDWLCGALAYPPSMLVNYTLHRSFTFRSDASHAHAGPRYIVVQGGGWVINTVGLWWGGEILGLEYWASQSLAIATVAVLSYIGQRFWTFGRVPEAGRKQDGPTWR